MLRTLCEYGIVQWLPAAQSFRLPHRAPAAMPCCWGSACSPDWRPGEPTYLAVTCACTAVYHPACANAGVFRLFEEDHEDDTCGTCGKHAALAQERKVAFPPCAPREGMLCDAPACPRKAGDLSYLMACSMCFQTVLCGPCQGSFYRGVAVLGELNAQRIEGSLPPVCGSCFAQFYATKKPEFVAQHKKALEATNADGLDAFKQALQRDTTLVSVPAPVPQDGDGDEVGIASGLTSAGTGQQQPGGSAHAAADESGATATAAVPPLAGTGTALAGPPLEVAALVFFPQKDKAGVIMELYEDGAARVVLIDAVESFTPEATGELQTKVSPGELQLLTHRPMDTVGRGRHSTGSNGSNSAKAGSTTFGLPTSYLFGVTGYAFGFWKAGMREHMRLGDVLSLAHGRTIATVSGDAQLVCCGFFRCTNKAWVALVLTAVGDVQTMIVIPLADLHCAAPGDRMPSAKLMPVLQRVRVHPRLSLTRQH